MTAKVITVFNQKGGCGKSTLTMNIAGALGLREYRVKIFDVDKQASSTQWYANAGDAGFPARLADLSKTAQVLHREIKADIESYDFIVIDCPPSIESRSAQSAMLVSDLALIPIVPSPVDFSASQQAKALVADVRALRPEPHLHAATVLNMVQRSTMAQTIATALRADPEIPLLNTQVGLRTAFRESQNEGTTVHKIPRASAAVTEIENLVDELLTRLN